MKEKLLLGIAIVMSGVLHAQFKISGEIQNYQEASVYVRIFTGASDKLINKVKTDKNGKFSVNIPENYNGIVQITNQGKHAQINILTDNTDVKFKTQYRNNEFSETIFLEGETAIAFQEFENYEAYNELKDNVFPLIKALYKEGDEFYGALIKEENRIKASNPVKNELEVLKYYIQVKELSQASQSVNTKTMADVYKNRIRTRLLNDSSNLEATGFLSVLVLDYLRYSILGATSQEEINRTLEEEIDKLLEETDLETSRGQNVLSAVFLVLPKEQFGELLQKYYLKANALTCTITDELSTSLSAHNLVPGTVVPNIIFSEPVKGYRSLYEIKATKKIIVFWASWCPACRNEMPYIKEYYENFKKEGGEIIAISLDYDENEFKAATKDYDWINYTELLQWDTQGVNSFGVTATPVMFLVDKDNKLIKKVDHISKLMD